MSNNKPIDITVEDFLDKNGLEYANYVIADRALVAADGDGLKPVHRRILYAMYNMGLKVGGKKIKANTIVGETIGRFHPHGDASTAGALARLGQSFSMRIPLLDYQGELGTVTGDTPASDRYWEATLNKAAWELIKDVQHKAVEMEYTEVGDYLEPTQLPARWPAAIINGGSGIAVGYASNMPSHNPDEVMNAIIANFQGKLNKTKDVLKHIKGPDFPTGGELVGVDGVKDYIETGTGTFTVRGRYTTTQLPRGRTMVTFYELPYQVSPEQVKIAIDKAQDNGKLHNITEVKDLSDGKQGLKLAIYVKAGTNIPNLVADLWKFTPCQSKYSVNNTLLVDRKPRRGISMLDIIKEYSDFKKSCFVRKTTHKLAEIEKSLYRYKGVLAVLVDLDKAIEIIRKSDTIEIASEKLQKKFKIEEEQASYILSMQLRRLTKSDSNEILAKANELESELSKLKAILADEKLLSDAIIEELKDTKKIISDPRRTEILSVTNEELAQEAKAQEKLTKSLEKGIPVYLIFSNNKIKKTLEFEPGSLEVDSSGVFYFVTSTGALIESPVSGVDLAFSSVANLVDSKKQQIVGITREAKDSGTLLVSSFGNIGIFKADKLKTADMTRLLPLEKIVYATSVNDSITKEKTLLMVSESGKSLPIDPSKLRFAGLGSGLIAGMKDAVVIGASLVTDLDFVYTESTNETKYTSVMDCPIKGRGGAGYVLHKLKPSDKIIKINVVEKVPKGNVSSARGGKGNAKK